MVRLHEPDSAELWVTREGYLGSTKSKQECKQEIDLPKEWERLRDTLFEGELKVYENHNDIATFKRRTSIIHKWNILVDQEPDSEETAKVQEAAWVYLRYIYLGYLTSLNFLSPAIQEVATATVTLLRYQLDSLPDSVKAVIDAELEKVTPKDGRLRLEECEAAVAKFVSRMTARIEAANRIGPGGVSRRRFKLLKERLEDED